MPKLFIFLFSDSFIHVCSSVTSRFSYICNNAKHKELYMRFSYTLHSCTDHFSCSIYTPRNIQEQTDVRLSWRSFFLPQQLLPDLPVLCLQILQVLFSIYSTSLSCGIWNIFALFIVSAIAVNSSLLSLISMLNTSLAVSPVNAVFMAIHHV